MREFLFQLIESGHVAVPPFDPHFAFRGKMPGRRASSRRWIVAPAWTFREKRPPGFAGGAMGSGGFYQACQLLVCRDVSAVEAGATLGVRCPQVRAPEVHYSVDLALRYLPDLLNVARRLAAGDALVDALSRIALEWPLSSVGVAGLKTGFSEVDTLIAHRGLRQLYVDRIIQHGAADRLQDARVNAAVRKTLGGYVQTLGPNFAALLDPAIPA